MNNKVKIALTVVIVLAAGALYYARSGNVNDLTSRTDYNTTLKCRACGHVQKANLQVTDRPPFVCEECGKKDAWHLWRCAKCKTTFVPEPEGDPPRAPMMPRCPECGSQSTGRAHGDQ